MVLSLGDQDQGRTRVCGCRKWGTPVGRARGLLCAAAGSARGLTRTWGCFSLVSWSTCVCFVAWDFFFLGRLVDGWQAKRTL